MRRAIYLAIAILLLSALPAAALPDHEYTMTYYDSNGDVAGGEGYHCGSGYYSYGSYTDSYVLEIYEPCLEAAPIQCTDIGLSELSGCEGIRWCVSDSYAGDFANDIVPNCLGTCSRGETANPYCCAINPLNCPAKQQLRRPKRPFTLRARQTLPSGRIRPPAMIWKTRLKSGTAPAGKFLSVEPRFSLERWHTYLVD